MPGFNFGTTIRGGVKSLPQPRYGSVPSPRSATEAAYGPSFTTATAGAGDALKPNDPFGFAFWLGVAGLAELIWLYHSLPA